MMNGMGFGMGFGWLFWIVLIVLAVWVVKMVLDNQRSHPSSPHRPDDALEILKRRYARGEIDDQEYERMRKQLMS